MYRDFKKKLKQYLWLLGYYFNKYEVLIAGAQVHFLYYLFFTLFLACFALFVFFLFLHFCSFYFFVLITGAQVVFLCFFTLFQIFPHIFGLLRFYFIYRVFYYIIFSVTRQVVQAFCLMAKVAKWPNSQAGLRLEPLKSHLKQFNPLTVTIKNN